MKAYKGIVENGVVVVIGARLPEGTTVTVTVGEGELLRATIVGVIGGGSQKLGKKIKLRPLPGLSTQFQNYLLQHYLQHPMPHGRSDPS